LQSRQPARFLLIRCTSFSQPNTERPSNKWGAFALTGDEGFQRRSVRGMLKATRLIIESFEGLHLFGVAKVRILDCRF